MNVYDLESFLGRLLRWLAAAVGLSLMILLLLNIFGPSVKGTPPDQAIMDVAGLLNSAGDSAERRITTVDFVDRPLFRPDRRQPPDLVSTSTKAQSEAVLESSERVESLEGVAATGVFASGDTSGVFLKAEGGKRSRVQVGDNFEGWVLESVDATGANFMAGSRRARVVLKLNFNPVVFAEPIAPDANAASDNFSALTDEAGKSSPDTRSELSDIGEDNAGAPRQALTFDSMMQERTRAREIQERESRE